MDKMIPNILNRNKESAIDFIQIAISVYEKVEEDSSLSKNDVADAVNEVAMAIGVFTGILIAELKELEAKYKEVYGKTWGHVMYNKSEFPWINEKKPTATEIKVFVEGHEDVVEVLNQKSEIEGLIATMEELSKQFQSKQNNLRAKAKETLASGTYGGY